ncbi:hypothetical protein ACFWPQ_34240 [Streptomyces sp. NPDC058464]|uniref:hypothetical protein n=1 Tax=Streptomyces sp. NPDC058464 TaxID=3346511 RepID=UPI00365A77AC
MSRCPSIPRIEKDVRQSFRTSTDFGLWPEEICTETERLLNDDGAAYQPIQ